MATVLCALFARASLHTVDTARCAAPGRVHAVEAQRRSGTCWAASLQPNANYLRNAVTST